MLIITRRQAHQLHAVLRRAFGTRGPGPALGFIADAEGLRVRARFADVAVEYRVPGEHPAETLWPPFQFLADCEARKDEPVTLTAADKGHVTAHWSDRGVPQTIQYDSAQPRDADKFPLLPATFAANPPSFLRAYTEASETVDPNSARYALGCLRLRGEDGSLAATDGRQLLLQSGFHFPWTGDVLAPNTKVFLAPDLPDDQPVSVGKTDDWLTIGIGPWYVHLKIDQHGRYPKIEQIVRSADQAVGVCRFSAADTRFLAETLPRLPVDSDNDNRVTLDLNGQVIIRAKTAKETTPTEVVINGASWSGDPVRLNVNCKQLARAVKLGLSNLYIFGDEAPVSWNDATRTYISSPLSRDCCVETAEGAIRIESPKGQPATPISQPAKPRRTPSVSESTSNTNGKATTNGRAETNGQASSNGQPRKTSSRKSAQQDLADLIGQAEKFRTAMHDLMHQAGGLVKALKQHRRQSRAVQQTIAQLRTLKTLGV